MATVLNSRKGFSLLEMLIGMLIVSALTILSMSRIHELNLDHYYFLNEYLLRQSEAMLNRKDDSFKKGVSFNSMGHVNQARTIDFENHQVIVHLGNGYATKE